MFPTRPARELFFFLFFQRTTALVDHWFKTIFVSRVDAEILARLDNLQKVCESRYHRVSFSRRAWCFKPVILNYGFFLKATAAAFCRSYHLAVFSCAHNGPGVELAFYVHGYNLNRGNLERSSGLTPRDHRDVILTARNEKSATPSRLLKYFYSHRGRANKRETRFATYLSMCTECSNSMQFVA